MNGTSTMLHPTHSSFHLVLSCQLHSCMSLFSSPEKPLHPEELGIVQLLLCLISVQVYIVGGHLSFCISLRCPYHFKVLHSNVSRIFTVNTIWNHFISLFFLNNIFFLKRPSTILVLPLHFSLRSLASLLQVVQFFSITFLCTVLEIKANFER